MHGGEHHGALPVCGRRLAGSCTGIAKIGSWWRRRQHRHELLVAGDGGTGPWALVTSEPTRRSRGRRLQRQAGKASTSSRERRSYASGVRQLRGASTPGGRRLRVRRPTAPRQGARRPSASSTGAFRRMVRIRSYKFRRLAGLGRLRSKRGAYNKESQGAGTQRCGEPEVGLSSGLWAFGCTGLGRWLVWLT